MARRSNSSPFGPFNLVKPRVVQMPGPLVLPALYPVPWFCITQDPGSDPSTRCLTQEAGRPRRKAVEPRERTHAFTPARVCVLSAAHRPWGPGSWRDALRNADTFSWLDPADGTFRVPVPRRFGNGPRGGRAPTIELEAARPLRGQSRLYKGEGSAPRDRCGIFNYRRFLPRAWRCPSSTLPQSYPPLFGFSSRFLVQITSVGGKGN